MRQFLRFSLASLTFLLVAGLSAQNRFVDDVFSDIQVEADVTYASNISIITGAPGLQELKMDVYTAADEDNDALNKPIVVLWHTGNFLPAYLNQGPYGTRQDSALVEVARRLVRKGYVAAIATYRQGWLPLATDLETRTGTLLQAAYRGAQDAHALARFLRKTVAEDGNPYQIDADRIVYWGFGTGGYVTLTHAFLDSYDEILSNDQFYDQNGIPLVIESINGNPQGTNATFLPPPNDNVPFNIPNNPSYSSDVAMSVNSGGALGDPAWMNGGGNEPMIVGYHSFLDPFAPFYEGTVVVPTTNETVVSGVAGTNQVLEYADTAGLNDDLADANMVPITPDIFSPLSNTVNTINSVYKQQTVTLGGILPNASNDIFQLSRDNMYSWTRPTGSSGTLGAPYNWFDEATLNFIVSQIPDSFGIQASAIIAGEGLTNPNYDNPAAARRYIDTMMAHFIPRAYIGLNLEELVSVEELIPADELGFTVAPNPAGDYFFIELAAGETLHQVSLYDFTGRRVLDLTDINSNRLRVDRGDLPRGQYVIRARVDRGVTAKKLILH